MKHLSLLAACALTFGITGCSKHRHHDKDMSADASYHKIMDPKADFEASAGDRVFFDTASNVLSAEARAVLDKQVAWLNAHPKVTAMVEGHADERGAHSYNMALGQRRANAVRRYLMAKGIDDSRLSTVSFGKDRPAVAGSNQAAWRQNRRAVSVIYCY